MIVNDESIPEYPHIEKNISLSNFSWFQIGGRADYFIKANSKEKIYQGLQFSRNSQIPFFVLGGGSNILFSDNGFRGLVIKIDEEIAVIENSNIKVTAGYDLKRIIKHSNQNNLGGWEELYGIPGTIGGAIRGNAGAFGKEIAQFVKSVSVIVPDGNENSLNKNDMKFDYRHSIIKENNWIITEVLLELEKVDQEESNKIIEEINSDRKRKHPSKMTAGCFFKNPKDFGVSAAKLIDEAGLKGKMIGGAKVSTKHSNFIVNAGNATANDVINLSELIKETIEKKHGIILKEEVQIVPDSV